MIDLTEFEEVSMHLNVVKNLIHMTYTTYLNCSFDEASLDDFRGVYFLIEEQLGEECSNLKKCIDCAASVQRQALPSVMKAGGLV